MRFLLWLIVIVSVLWGGYWVVGSHLVEKKSIAAIEQANQSGYEINYSSLNTSGFPNRFDTTIEDIDLRTPSNIQWIAPFFQVFALSYKPYHLIAVWPHEQSISFGDRRLGLVSTDLRASLVVEANATFALNRFQLSGAGLALQEAGGAPLLVDELSIATRQGGEAFSHDLSIIANRVTLPTLVGSHDVDNIMVDANLIFDGPIGNTEVPPMLTRLSLKTASIAQNASQVLVSGDLTFDTGGYASGSLTLTAKNWENGFRTLQELNLIPADYADNLRGVLAALANANGDSTNIAAPLSVKRGTVMLGFLPLGVIPPL